MALTIAITYGNQRRQFNAASDTDEEVLLDYQRHQRRLLPKLATTYAQIFAHDEFLVKFDAVFSGKADTDDDRQDLETIAAALKPLSTWHALETLQEAREASGGAGFLAENRIVGLRQDLDVYVTFEGDNNVLLQLVAKRLLTDFSKQFAKADAGAMARYVVHVRPPIAPTTAPGSAASRRRSPTSARRARSVSELRDEDTQRELLTDRVEAMIAEIAGRLRDARKLPEGGCRGGVQPQPERADRGRPRPRRAAAVGGVHARPRAARPTPARSRCSRGCATCSASASIEKHLAWYLINGRLSPQRAQAVTAYIDRLIERLRPHAQDLVDAFGYRPSTCGRRSPSGAEQERQDEARAYYAAQRAAGTLPVPEKSSR